MQEQQSTNQTQYNCLLSFMYLLQAKRVSPRRSNTIMVDLHVLLWLLWNFVIVRLSINYWKQRFDKTFCQSFIDYIGYLSFINTYLIVNYRITSLIWLIRGVAFVRICDVLVFPMLSIIWILCTSVFIC